ncbi:unnamed protein product [Cyclocybe aegerita]|uniref:Uncharacterized protein n=1 Tax=Cyclocybe aegerita TaxID=1973307 RepID=A0A8S0W008_CYCAE|nr:unnamed protein product [Cyclocybe aegerita]
MQCKVLDLVHQAACSLAVTGHRVIFLVANRPEPEISQKFSTDLMGDITTYYTLGNSEDSKNDVRLFLQGGFQEIRKIHPLRNSIPPSWPRLGDIDKLVRKASGQFLYAHIVIDYVRSIRHRPNHRLAKILALSPEQGNNPFEDLDALYTHVFSSIDSVDSVLRVLGLSLSRFTSKNFTFGDIVRDRLGLNLEDVQLLFGGLTSVIEIAHIREGKPDAWELTVRHASLAEFLTNQRRPKQYFLDVNLSRAEWVSWLLRNDLEDGSTLFKLADALSELRSCKSQELHDTLRDCHLGLLLSKASLPSSKTASVKYIYDIITMIKEMSFEDAEALYKFQLKVFETQIPLILGQFYCQPACLPLLLNNFTTVEPESPARALSYMVGVEEKRIEIDPLGLWWRPAWNSQLHVFLSTFIRDPSRSLQYAVNGSKLAEAGIALIHFLCHPTTPTDILRVIRQYTRSLKYRPWTSRGMRRSRFRTAPGKWFIHRCCDLCGEAHTPVSSCPHRDENESNIATLAYRASPRSPLIVLHRKPKLLGYRFALAFLPDMLAEASRSSELIQYCKKHAFHPTSILFPRKSKPARRAISNYLNRMDAEERGWWLD